MRCRKYLIFHGIYPIRNQTFPRAFFYTVIDTGRNLPEHPKQISRLQSRPLAFVRMCLKAALTAKRLICKKTLAGCDRAVCQPVKPEDRFLLIFFAVKNEQIAGFWQNTGFCSCSLSNLHEQKTEQLCWAKNCTEKLAAALQHSRLYICIKDKSIRKGDIAYE